MTTGSLFPRDQSELANTAADFHPPGKRLYRMIPLSHYKTPLGRGSPASRFFDSSCALIGPIYFAESVRTCAFEKLVSGKYVGADIRIIAMSTLIEQAVVAVERVQPFKVLKLTRTKAAKFGLHRDILGAEDHSAAQAWATAFRTAHTEVEAFQFRSTMSDGWCFAYFPVATDPFSVFEIKPLLETPRAIPMLENELRLNILP